jgi:hypothetical protein
VFSSDKQPHNKEDWPTTFPTDWQPFFSESSHWRCKNHLREISIHLLQCTLSNSQDGFNCILFFILL